MAVGSSVDRIGVAGRWSVVVSCCQDLSGRIGVRGLLCSMSLLLADHGRRGPERDPRISCSWGDPPSVR
jgi:hypothetical protein